MSDKSFPKQRRLLKRQEFQSLALSGKVTHSTSFLISVGVKNTETGRFGITVTRKVGNACLRNRIKRICREAYRIEGKTILENSDVNLVVKKSARLRSNHALYRELKKLFIQASGEG